MKAYRFEQKGPIGDVLKLRTIEKPAQGPNESLVRVVASAINPSDAKNVEGGFPATTLPRTPGRDFAGVVQGGEYDGLEVWGTGGDHGIQSDGSHAEYIVIPNEGVTEKPKNLSFAQAAASGLGFLTAWSMVERAGVQKGSYVLVLGSSGAVGGAATQICKYIGATPIETARSEKPGAVNTSAESLEPQIQAVTNGAGVDVVLDTVSDPLLFQKALRTLNRRGKYVVITAPRSPDGLLSFNALDLYRQDRSLMGVNTLNISFLDGIKIIKSLKAGFENGTLLPPPLIHEVDLQNEAETVKAYQGVLKGAKGKYVLVSSK